MSLKSQFKDIEANEIGLENAKRQKVSESDIKHMMLNVTDLYRNYPGQCGKVFGLPNMS